jgi:hypothetical protein
VIIAGPVVGYGLSHFCDYPVVIGGFVAEPTGGNSFLKHRSRDFIFSEYGTISHIVDRVVDILPEFHR